MEAEKELKSQSKQSEERVSSLESKLSELSQVVGNYEKLRFQDQQAIGCVQIVVFVSTIRFDLLGLHVGTHPRKLAQCIEMY